MHVVLRSAPVHQWCSYRCSTNGPTRYLNPWPHQRRRQQPSNLDQPWHRKMVGSINTSGDIVHLLLGTRGIHQEYITLCYWRESSEKACKLCPKHRHHQTSNLHQTTETSEIYIKAQIEIQMLDYVFWCEWCTLQRQVSPHSEQSDFMPPKSWEH